MYETTDRKAGGPATRLYPRALGLLPSSHPRWTGDADSRLCPADLAVLIQLMLAVVAAIYLLWW
jgi:hypothetical protein